MARRLLAYCLLVAVVCVSAPAWAVTPAMDTMFGEEMISITDEGEFSKLAVEGCRSMSDVGNPALPIKVLRFLIPRDMRVDEVVITRLAEQEIPGFHRIFPAQPQVPTGETPEWADPNPAVYGSESVYPANRVEYLGDGYLGGYRIANVAVYPLQYQPAIGRLVLATDVSVELSLVPGADRSHPRERITSGSYELYREVVAGMVENPEALLGRYAPVEVVEDVGPDGFLPRYTPSLEGSPVEYVIITNDALAPKFQILANWKTKKGVPTVVKTVSWIEANYPGGTDTAERIRFFIQDAYSSWGTSFILLGGDTNIIPVRMAWSAYYGGWEVSSDLYYTDLDGNWNLDGDSRYGEGYAGITSPGDSIDLYPDIFVGRAPAQTAFEAETFVTKTLTYEKNPSPLFAERNLFLAEVLFPYDWQPGDLISTDGAQHVVEPVIPLIPAWIHNAKVYQNYEPYADSWPLSAAAAIDSINRGYNIVSHVGHGNKDILRCSLNEYITVQDIDGLVNSVDLMGLVWMLNCTSNAIEFDCIDEHFMNNPDGGATFIYGPTRFCFPTTAKDYYYEWFRLLYVDHTERAGVVSAMCKIPFVIESSYDNTDRWTQMSFLLLGDPESRLWTKRPVDLSVVHDSSVELGETDLFVTVLDPAAVDSAFVCVAKSGEVYATGYTNASGQATLSFTPQTTGSMTITVTARNHFPYEDTIGVTSTSAAHVSLRSAAVDDDAVGSSDGNANTVAEAGETVELDITVGNGGLAQATAVTATLTTSDSYVTITDGTEALGDIAAAAVLAFGDAFVVEIADGCPNDHQVDFTVQFDEAARASWTSDYTMHVNSPILTQRHNDYDEGGDGIPDVGETVTLTVDVLNEGNGDADVVTGVLRYPSAEVTITDSTDAWGDIDASQTASGQNGFVFTVNSAITGEFELELQDEDGKVWTHAFDVVAPVQPLNLDGRVKATTIYLMWDPVADADLWGYNVYRTDHPFGTFVAVNDGVVERISYYQDAGLDENQRYYYYVTAVDSSGNEGPGSETLEMTTNPPSQAGWPLLGGEAMYGTPALVDVNLDGELEVIVGSGEVFGWYHNGVEITDGDGDPRTEGVLASDGTGGYRSSIAVGELDGDSYPEIVGAAWGNVGTIEHPSYEIWAWNAEDGTVVPGWPAVTLRFCWATPALGDLDNDGLDEVIIPCADGNLYVWKSDGTGLLNPNGVFAYLDFSWAYGSPALVDIDRDNELEILVSSRSESVYCFNRDGTNVLGWPVNMGAPGHNSVAAGDVLNNGLVEVVATTNGNEIRLLNSEGLTFPGWPQTIELNGDFPPSPSLADLNGDGELEIICTSSTGIINVWTWDGNPYPGWPQNIGETCYSSAAIGDVDADAGLEIVIGFSDGKVYAFDTDGTQIDGWPIQTDAEIYSTPTLGDLDMDNDVEVVVSGMDANVYVWDCDGTYDDGDGVEWASFRHNFKRTGYYDFEPWAGVEDGDDWTTIGLRLEQNVPNPFNPITSIAFNVPDGVSEIDLSVYNVAGVRISTLVSGTVSPGTRSVTWDGTDASGEKVASGIYFVRMTANESAVTRKMVLLK